MDKRNQRPAGKASGPGLAAGYRPLPGIPDEMVDSDGKVRPSWSTLVSALDRIGPSELTTRFERADQYLRDAGVFYRKYDNAAGKDRAWPLSHIPLILDETEWETITRGLRQRADLLERVVADIYGEANLITRGLIPPELIAGNPEFLRPMVGVKPASGHFLHFCAFELGRGPDGGWWVLGDRTQAPSGAGFALENRVATTRALSDIYAGLNVHRLAGFFRDFRDALNAEASANGDGRVGILTPGQHNETYFEHAYIARYLGFMLLEGEDLVIEDGEVMVRTVAGLQPLRVLWRRMDASFVDPLELRYDSRIGTPGMIEAVRNRAISIVNALGTGILETRALGAFMPRISQALLGQPLDLPAIATWWCGQPNERAHVAANLDAMMVGPAFSTILPFDDQQETTLGSAMAPDLRAKVIDGLAREGAGYVGQEPVRLSTAPVFTDGRLEPRPITLRVYAARTASGWTIMPGGFARVGSTPDTAAIAMQRGGRAADVWVVSDKPVERVSLLPPGEKLVRISVGTLPSRAADNLIWLGRYAERCEATVRILRAYNVRLAEVSNPSLAILEDTRAYLDQLGVEAEEGLPTGLLASIDRAVSSASQIRDRFSPDGWLALADLQKTARNFAARVKPGDDATRAMTVLLRKLAGFSGLVHENMYRFAGWRFLEMGRRLERGIQIAGITAWFTRPDAPDGALEMLLEIGDSVMTHRRRYAVTAGPRSAVDLLVLDPLNPRSALFQVSEIRQQLETLPGGLVEGQRSPAAKAALRLETSLVTADPDDFDTGQIDAIGNEIARIAGLIADAYFA